MHPAIKAGNVALITGSSYGGIGFAFAKKLAVNHSMRVALADLDEPNLKKAEKVLLDSGVKQGDIFIRKTDVSQLSQMQSLADEVYKKFDRIDLLHLNAGTGGSSTATGDRDAWDKILGVNFYGVLNGGQAIASRLIESHKGDAAIIITGSKQGITCPPGSGPAYNVSKAAVKVYAEALAHEVRQKNDKITVSLLVPGWVHSKLTVRNKGADIDDVEKPDGAWTPDQTVDYMLEKLEKKEFYIICPDNETSEAMDVARMKWSATDAAEKRPALSRWHPDFKDEFEKFMKKETGGS